MWDGLFHGEIQQLNFKLRSATAKVREVFGKDLTDENVDAILQLLQSDKQRRVAWKDKSQKQEAERKIKKQNRNAVNTLFLLNGMRDAFIEPVGDKKEFRSTTVYRMSISFTVPTYGHSTEKNGKETIPFRNMQFSFASKDLKQDIQQRKLEHAKMNAGSNSMSAADAKMLNRMDASDLEDQARAIHHLKDVIDFSLGNAFKNRILYNSYVSSNPEYSNSTIWNLLIPGLRQVLGNSCDAVAGFKQTSKNTFSFSCNGEKGSISLFPQQTMLEEFDLRVTQQDRDANQMFAAFGEKDTDVIFGMEIKCGNMYAYISAFDKYEMFPFAKEVCYIEHKKVMESSAADMVMERPKMVDAVVKISDPYAVNKAKYVEDAALVMRMKTILQEQQEFEGLTARQCIFFHKENCGLQGRRTWAVLDSIWEDSNKKLYLIRVCYILQTIILSSYMRMKRNTAKVMKHLNAVGTIRSGSEMVGAGSRGSLVKLRGNFAQVQSLLLSPSSPSLGQAVTVPERTLFSLPPPPAHSNKAEAVEELERKAKQALEVKKMSTPTLSIKESQIVAAAHAKKLPMEVAGRLLSMGSAAASRVFA